jgi:hypothetical protein
VWAVFVGGAGGRYLIVFGLLAHWIMVLAAEKET